MSGYELKEKNGTLFSNDRKEKDNQPDYKGKVLIEGKTYEIAGWKKTSQASGKNFLSLKLTEKEGK